jgi:hypothetical protein
MARPDEDQPNRALPDAAPPEELTSHAQHWRLHVPRPATTLMLGQRVPETVDQEAADGYPGVTLHTEAGVFVDVRERTVWQGHDVIAFQSTWNTEVHGGHAVVIGATAWNEAKTEPTSGTHVGRTRGQDRLYAQLRRQALGVNDELLRREAIGAAKTFVNTPLKFGPIAKGMFSLVKRGVTGVLPLLIRSGTLKPDAEPGTGVYISSNAGVFVGSESSTTLYARKGFNILAGGRASSFYAQASGTATLASATSAEVFGLSNASLASMGNVDATAGLNAALVAKRGVAIVVGPTVTVGSQAPGPLVARQIGVNPALLRPTTKLTLEAVESITSNVVGKFKINAPLGEVESTSRKATVEAAERVTVKTPFGKVEISASGVLIDCTVGGIVKVDAMGVTVTGGVYTLSVGRAGLSASGGGASVTMVPGGVVSVQGTVVKLG